MQTFARVRTKKALLLYLKRVKNKRNKEKQKKTVYFWDLGRYRMHKDKLFFSFIDHALFAYGLTKDSFV